MSCSLCSASLGMSFLKKLMTSCRKLILCTCIVSVVFRSSNIASVQFVV